MGLSSLKAVKSERAFVGFLSINQRLPRWTPHERDLASKGKLGNRGGKPEITHVNLVGPQKQDGPQDSMRWRQLDLGVLTIGYLQRAEIGGKYPGPQPVHSDNGRTERGLGTHGKGVIVRSRT